MDQQKKEALKVLVEKLTHLGEDKNELHFWEQIFEDLTAEEQTKLLGILEKELGELQGLT